MKSDDSEAVLPSMLTRSIYIYPFKTHFLFSSHLQVIGVSEVQAGVSLFPVNRGFEMGDQLPSFISARRQKAL